jgi:hypothetical protein
VKALLTSEAYVVRAVQRRAGAAVERAGGDEEETYMAGIIGAAPTGAHRRGVPLSPFDQKIPLGVIQILIPGNAQQ